MYEVIVYKHLVSFQLTAAEVKCGLHKLQSFCKAGKEASNRIVDIIVAFVLMTTICMPPLKT